MHYLRLNIIFTFFCLAGSPSGLTADLAYGEYLAGECVTCHRAGAASAASAESGIPPINALPPPYFIEALREYRDGERDHDLMRNIARSLGDAEMEALAAFFEQLED